MSDTTLSLRDPKTAAAMRMLSISPDVQAAVARGLLGMSYMQITECAHDRAFEALAGTMLSLSGLSQNEQDNLAPFITGRLESIGPLGIEIGAHDAYVATFAHTLLHPTSGPAH